MSSNILTASLLLLIAALTTSGQTTDAQCLPFYDWTDNTHKQSPCQVAANLIGICTPFNVGALPESTHYIGPSMNLATPCQCNTVVYSLMSACGACQGRSYSAWSEWTANCAVVSVGSYPEALPINTYVPAWAYLDVKTGDRFNETAARLAVNGTEHAAPTPSSTSSVPNKATSTHSGSIGTKATSKSETLASISLPLAPSDSTSVPSSALASAPASTSSDPRLNAIIGGTVGGVLGLALIGTIAIWLVLRYRERRAKFGMAPPSSTNVSEPPTRPEAEGSGNLSMAQYVANTIPQIVTPSRTTSSLPSPTSAKFSGSVASASIRSVGPSNV